MQSPYASEKDRVGMGKCGLLLYVRFVGWRTREYDPIWEAGAHRVSVALREHLACIKNNIFKYYICSRKSLGRWIYGIGRERIVSKKIAEMALEYTPNADIERFLFFMDKLYTSSIISTEAIGQVVK